MLVVPETRGKRNGRFVSLAVAIVRARAPGKRSDPVIYLHGGPGGSAVPHFNTASHEHNNFDATSIYYNLAGYSLANLRIGAKRRGFKSSLFINNLFDKHAETALYESYATNLPTTRRIGLNRPRTIGMDLRYGW
jgi:hypothetical protein